MDYRRNMIGMCQISSIEYRSTPQSRKMQQCTHSHLHVARSAESQNACSLRSPTRPSCHPYQVISQPLHPGSESDPKYSFLHPASFCWLFTTSTLMIPTFCYHFLPSQETICQASSTSVYEVCCSVTQLFIILLIDLLFIPSMHLSLLTEIPEL